MCPSYSVCRDVSPLAFSGRTQERFFPTPSPLQSHTASQKEESCCLTTDTLSLRASEKVGVGGGQEEDEQLCEAVYIKERGVSKKVNVRRTGMNIVLVSGASRLGCSATQVKFWPVYTEDRRSTELLANTKPSSWTSVSVAWLMVVLFSAYQLIVAAEATLTTEHCTFVRLWPSFHVVLALTVMFGRAAWEREDEQQRMRHLNKDKNLWCAFLAEYVWD